MDAPQPIEERLQKAIDKALYSGGSATAQKLRNFLNGVWLGEPLHVVLTDAPIGAWTMALVFDGFELMTHRREFALAADMSIAIGLVGATGAAVTGVTDWLDVDPPARRIGMMHGLLNVGATAAFAASFVLRKKKSRIGGRLCAALGFAVMTFAARLGGQMIYEHRVGVDRTDGESFPEQFVPVMPESGLENDKLTRAFHEGVPILLVRREERLFAMAETCSHFGGPLSEGKLVGDSVVCPWHASRFALADGHVINGPAVHPQPCLAVRIRDGQIEVCKPARNDGKPSAAVAGQSA